MCMKHKIYIITNGINGKQYIGYTGKSIDKRFKEHTRSQRPIGKAIRKHGVENFSIALLDESDSKEDALLLEMKYIVDYETRSRGYNCSKGGDINHPIYNQKIQKSKDFSDRMKTQANNQHNDPIKKQNHADGIKKYWISLDEETKKEKIEIARRNGKKSVVAWNKGLKQPESGMKGDKNPMAKTYIVFYPDGKEEIIKCLNTFCKNNNLCSRCVYKMLEGKQANHKGFRFARLDNHP